MNRLRAVVLALTAVLPLSAYSAEITRVASSFEDDHPFGMFIDVGFERTQRLMLISQEFHDHTDATDPNSPIGVVDKPELRYTGVDYRLKLDAHIGIWKDLELHYGLPVVLSSNEYYNYAGGTNNSTSTLAANANNCVLANGQLADPNCPTTGAGSQAIAKIPATSYRAGLGNMTFGLAYALFNQLKDDTKPTWVVAFDYEAPTADALDPTDPTSSTAPGKIGDRVHKYMFSTAFSRRMGVVDPYFKLQLNLPFRGPGWYSNCDHPDPTNMAHPENCNTTDWSRLSTGIQYPTTANVLFGSEFNLVNDPGKHQKVSLDLRTIANYIGPGRYYNELSSIFHELLYTGDYLEVGGSVGLNAYASDYIRLQATASLLYNTPHLLTNEPIGRDLDNDGVVNIDTNPREFNPNFDYRKDAPSRHFIASEIAVFRINVTASFNF